MKIKLLTWVLLIGLVPILFGCGKNTSSVPVSPLDSPLGIPMSSLPTPETSVVPFQLDKPIVAGATRVTGSGPAGVPIVLLDVTFGGSLLASGVIDQDGRFELELEEPLEAHHRIGIAIGDLSGTGWRLQDFAHDGFYGDEALNVPQVGFFFDTCVIQE